MPQAFSIDNGEEQGVEQKRVLKKFKRVLEKASNKTGKVRCYKCKWLGHRSETQKRKTQFAHNQHLCPDCKNLLFVTIRPPEIEAIAVNFKVLKDDNESTEQDAGDEGEDL